MTNFREMTNNKKFIYSIAFFFITAQIFAQITIKSLPINSEIIADSNFSGKNFKRVIKQLSDNWKVYSENNPGNKINTTVPAVFDGYESLVYETSVDLSSDEIEDNSIKLVFLGVNYSSEILLNNYSIFKRAGGEIPFEIELPKDILKSGSKNKIQIKVNSKLNSDYTIPALQRFLFPALQRGISRDVFLQFAANTNISKLGTKTSVDGNLSKGKIDFVLTLKNLNQLKTNTDNPEQLTVRIKLKPSFAGSTEQSFEHIINKNNKDEIETSFSFEVQNPTTWSPSTPNYYNCEVQLIYGQQSVDLIQREISFIKLAANENSLTLNNQSYELKGTTYFLNEAKLSQTDVYRKIENDLKLIKETGFNSVRFSKAYPHPYALTVCQRIGLLALVELPLNSIPEEILENSDFQLTVKSRLKELVDEYSRYSSSIVYGLGGGFLPNSQITENFLSNLSEQISSKGFLTYASFYGIQTNKIESVNLFGIELFARTSADAEEFISGIEDAKYFISEINYPKYVGSANGYLVQNSEEAQAKFLANMIEISRRKNLCGFYVNTIFNYTGDYNSLYAFSENNSYALGILEKKSLQNSLPYKVLKSKLLNEGKVTIPIGSRKDENKLIFIILALALSVIMAVLINTKKKFREDCTRALIRPYNFYADIRDHRILSSIHTFILLLVETASAALFLAITLYYLRTNILLEKILLSFGDATIINTVSNLAWHPEKSFIYVFAALLIKVGFLTLIIKLASFSLKIRVETLSIFYSIVWAFLPFTLLLPVELILYKILAAYGINIYALGFLVVFWLWILQRVIKGIHVIFDVRPAPVYFYSLLTIVLVLGGIVFYYQFTNSTIYYLNNAIRQYTSMSF